MIFKYRGDINDTSYYLIPARSNTLAAFDNISLQPYWAPPRMVDATITQLDVNDLSPYISSNSFLQAFIWIKFE